MTIGDGNSPKDVNVQDQTSPPIDSYFLQSISNFDLVVDTIESTITVLQYTVVVSPLHGIIVGNEILLLDTVANTSFFATVLAVVVDTLTVDRPIDHVYTVAGALGRKVTSHMNVNGSVTPQVFSLRAGQIPSDITRVMINMLSSTSMDDGKFGDLPILTRGLVFRIIDSFNKTIFNFKTNGEITNFCFDTKYADRAPGGKFGFNARVTFAGQSKHGVALRIKEGDVLQWIVQDDLSTLDNLQTVAQGHDTVGEV